MNLPQYVIVVAGGSGLRMGTELPKQFLVLNNLPILFHSILAFYRYNPQIKIIVVAPKSHFKTIAQLQNNYGFNIPFSLAAGGETRFLSVKNGLAQVPENALVGIHDAVRPMVSQSTITKAYQSAMDNGNGIPVVDVIDSLRQVKNNTNQAVNRSEYRIVQTPQVFKSTNIKQAFDAATHHNFSDDASVAEANQQLIFLTEGNKQNIKITTPEDLKIAEFFVQAVAQQL